MAEPIDPAVTALRAYARLTSRWQLGDPEAATLAGAPDVLTYRGWVGLAQFFDHPVFVIGEDRERLLVRLSTLAGIAARIDALHPDDAAAADVWVRRPNADPNFGGDTPLDVMLAGGAGALGRVWAHVDAVLARRATARSEPESSSPPSTADHP